VGAGMSVAITLDDQILLERGHIGYQQDQAPLIGRRLDLRLIWLDADALVLGEKLNLRLGTQELEARVDAIHDVMDLETLVPEIARTVPQNAIARITISTRKPLTADPNDPLSPTGRAVLARGHRVVAGALVTNLSDHASDNLTTVTSAVSAVERRRVNGHAGGVLWLTGLSGSGKSTLAIALEAALMARGWRAFVLDGDNLRRGLNSDLDFSPTARAENMRRAAEVAKLMSDSGLVTIVSLISPYQAERARAKRIIGDGFREIHIAADLATCIARDPKGLYARAQQGLIRDFTGIDSPYEAPTNPDLVIDTGAKAFADNLTALLTYALSQFDLDARRISNASLGDGI
jgi:bifunctional enzyme CysN/CysC